MKEKFNGNNTEEVDGFLQEILSKEKTAILQAIHVCIPGRVVSYDPGTGLATIQPGLMRKTADGKLLSMPQMMDLPALLPGKDYQPKKGDACLVLFADFCLDGWLETGEPLLPASPRMHDLSDGIAILGYFPAMEKGSSGAAAEKDGEGNDLQTGG